MILEVEHLNVQNLHIIHTWRVTLYGLRRFGRNYFSLGERARPGDLGPSCRGAKYLSNGIWLMSKFAVVIEQIDMQYFFLDFQNFPK